MVGLILLSDIRHPLKQYDLTMLAWATESNLPLHLLLTKSDKLKHGAAQNALLRVRKETAALPGVSVQLFSSLKKTGLDEAKEIITKWLTPK